MWERLRSMWVISDIRNKLFFTLGMLLVFRILSNIVVPLTHDQEQKLLQLFTSGREQALSQLLGLLDAFSGGSLQQFSIVALGVAPYITASIVVQLLTSIIPAWQKMQKDGESGQQHLTRITRFITVPVALLQAVGQLGILVRAGVFDSNAVNLFGPHWLSVLTLLITLTTGTMILVWIGELITQHGIGNGISLIIFAGIVSSLPGIIRQDYVTFSSRGFNGGSVVTLAVSLLLGLLIILGTVYLYQGQRRVPMSYPTKRQMGRDLLIGKAQKTYLPMQVNSAGMIPLLFANSTLLLPSLIAQYLASSPIPWLASAAQWSDTYLTNMTQWPSWLIYFGLVVAFTYLYTTLQWRQRNIAENLQKQGAVITGYRPGEPTHVYLFALLNRLTLGGAVCLGMLAIIPFVTQVGSNQVLNSAKLLIVVGVILDTLRQLDAQMAMHNYTSFLSEE